MTDQYNQIYSKLYDEYLDILGDDISPRRTNPLLGFESYLILRTKYFIDNPVEDKPEQSFNLRADAKYFLLINFHHMIIAPLLEQQQPSESDKSKVEITSIENSFKSDIDAIITTANDEILSNEISGHQIMRAIDKLWNNLKTTKFEIWG